MSNPVVLTPERTREVHLGGLGVRFLVGGEQTGGRVALVEHPIAPRALAAPLHTHEREDEISYVVAGQVGVQIGDRVEVAGPGAVIFKPRGIPHAFWNAGDTPALVMELITPAGFEGYFAEMAALFDADGGLPDPERAAAVCAKYGLNLDLRSIPGLVQAHGLTQ
jgi:quercetin dioxygenase-like cupin family protein